MTTTDRKAEWQDSTGRDCHLRPRHLFQQETSVSCSIVVAIRWISNSFYILLCTTSQHVEVDQSPAIISWFFSSLLSHSIKSMNKTELKVGVSHTGVFEQKTANTIQSSFLNYHFIDVMLKRFIFILCSKKKNIYISCLSCQRNMLNVTSFKIIRKCQTKYEAKLQESLLIKNLNPKTNA